MLVTSKIKSSIKILQKLKRKALASLNRHPPPSTCHSDVTRAHYVPSDAGSATISVITDTCLFTRESQESAKRKQTDCCRQRFSNPTFIFIKITCSSLCFLFLHFIGRSIVRLKTTGHKAFPKARPR